MERIKPRFNCCLPGTQPSSVTLEQKHKVEDEFMSRDCSTHSEKGATMWIVISLCRSLGWDYTVWKHERGYMVMRGGVAAQNALASLGFAKIEGF